MIKDKDNVTLSDVLQPGKDMLAAGYCMYGSSCTVISSSNPSSLKTIICSVPFELTCATNLMQLVLSTGSGVNGFTLDPSLGEFILTHPDIKVIF